MAKADKLKDKSKRSLSAPTRFSAAQFLIALILLVCTSPALDDLSRGDLIEALLLTLVLLSAIPAVGGSRRTVVFACLLALPAVAGKWLDHFTPGLIPNPIFLASAIVFATFIVWHHFGFILRAPEVDTQVLCAGVSTFLMLGLLWAFGYLLIDSIAPKSFSIQMGQGAVNELSGFNALYYSLGTLSGVSFGEITPISDAARMSTLLEAITSLFYFAILISRLVALHTERATLKKRESTDTNLKD